MNIGKILKTIAALEMAATCLWAVIILNAIGADQCSGISDLVAHYECKTMVETLANGQRSMALYVFLAGSVGALLLYAFGRMMGMVEEMHAKVMK